MIILEDILYIILVVGFLFVIKPNIIFKPNGHPRNFGLGYDSDGYKKTLLNLGVVIVVFTIFYIKYMNKKYK